MNKSTQDLSVIAYYLSKYDKEAVKLLGFPTQQKALSELSALYGHANAYLKMRRDEFDVVTGSHRKGFRNRKPALSVSNLAALLDQYSFDELSIMISDMICQQKGENETPSNPTSDPLTEETTIEDVLNGFNSNAQLVESVGKRYQRVYDANSIEKLKKHYRYCCQICGLAVGSEYGVNLAEAHHIIPFSVSRDNSITNLIILCPNHYRLLHKSGASFDSENTCFILSASQKLYLTLNDHL